MLKACLKGFNGGMDCMGGTTRTCWWLIDAKNGDEDGHDAKHKKV